jgi:hypothetical protein
MGVMASPKKSIVIFGIAIGLENEHDIEGYLEVCPKGESQGNNPLPHVEFSYSKYGSLCK